MYANQGMLIAIRSQLQMQAYCGCHRFRMKQRNGVQPAHEPRAFCASDRSELHKTKEPSHHRAYLAFALEQTQWLSLRNRTTTLERRTDSDPLVGPRLLSKKADVRPGRGRRLFQVRARKTAVCSALCSTSSEQFTSLINAHANVLIAVIVWFPPVYIRGMGL